MNVTILNKPGVTKALLQQLNKHKIKIAALQEIRWIGRGITDLKTHTTCYSGKEVGDRDSGVAFVTDKQIKNAILDFKPVNERICTLRIKTKFFNLTAINAHAPMDDKEAAVKGQFYQQLERVYDAAPINDTKMISGDLNAKVGKERVQQRNHRCT
jgi:exonuclease III